MINYKKMQERERDIKINEIEEIQNAQCGNTEKDYSISTKIRKNYSINDELGVHRKVIQIILTRLGLTNEEFSVLCEEISKAKEKTEEEINMRTQGE